MRNMSESLTINFSPQREARFFLHLLETGIIDYARACESIELSERQRDWLIQQQIAEEWQVKALFELRQETLRHFRDLVEHGAMPASRHSEQRHDTLMHLLTKSAGATIYVAFRILSKLSKWN